MEKSNDVIVEQVFQAMLKMPAKVISLDGLNEQQMAVLKSVPEVVMYQKVRGQLDCLQDFLNSMSQLFQQNSEIFFGEYQNPVRDFSEANKRGDFSDLQDERYAMNLVCIEQYSALFANNACLPDGYLSMSELYRHIGIVMKHGRYLLARYWHCHTDFCVSDEFSELLFHLAWLDVFDDSNASLDDLYAEVMIQVKHKWQAFVMPVVSTSD